MMIFKKEKVVEEYVEYEQDYKQAVVKLEDITFTSEELLQEDYDFEQETKIEKLRRLIKPIKCLCYILNCRDVSSELKERQMTIKKILFGEAGISDEQNFKFNSFTHVMSSLVRMRMPGLQNNLSMIISELLHESQGNFEMMILSLNFHVASNISCKICKKSWDFISMGKNVIDKLKQE